MSSSSEMGAVGSNDCLICMDGINSRPWGVCTPCGHAFHRECWQQWEQSRIKDNVRQGRSLAREGGVKCCSCNGVNHHFVNVYVDVVSSVADGAVALRNDAEDENDDSSLGSYDDDSGRNAAEEIVCAIDRDDDETLDLTRKVEDKRAVGDVNEVVKSESIEGLVKANRDLKRQLKQMKELNKKRGKVQKEFLAANAGREIQLEIALKKLNILRASTSDLRSELQMLALDMEKSSRVRKKKEMECASAVTELQRRRTELEATRKELERVKKKHRSKVDELTKEYQSKMKQRAEVEMKEVSDVLLAYPKVVQQKHDLALLCAKKDDEISELQQRVNKFEQKVRSRIETEAREFTLHAAVKKSRYAKASDELRNEISRKKRKRDDGLDRNVTKPTNNLSQKTDRLLKTSDLTSAAVSSQQSRQRHRSSSRGGSGLDALDFATARQASKPSKLEYQSRSGATNIALREQHPRRATDGGSDAPASTGDNDGPDDDVNWQPRQHQRPQMKLLMSSASRRAGKRRATGSAVSDTSKRASSAAALAAHTLATTDNLSEALLSHPAERQRALSGDRNARASPSLEITFQRKKSNGGDLRSFFNKPLD